MKQIEKIATHAYSACAAFLLYLCRQKLHDMKNRLLLSLLLGCMVLPMAAVNIIVDKVTRSYLEYVPKNLGENRPLLISCHGMNQDAAYQKGMLVIESVADTAKFVTVFPEGIDKGWDISGDRDIKFVLALIDEMVTKYKIDRKRVYLSGFSMGGMFTYHAMNKIADKIAAFAPISGYPMGGATANANVRPIPIIHTHGTGDDVVGFGGVQGALDVWIKHNGCPLKAKVQTRYRNAGHITRHTWGPGNDGVEVVLMEMADKGHWISNDNGVKTGDEIWRFCKRYSLDLKDPTVKFTSPADGLTFVTIGGKSEVPPITLTASASDPDGKVASVAFYNGKELLAKVDQAPYTCVVEGLKVGSHELYAVVTDDEGRTGSNSVVVDVEEPTKNYLLHNTFLVANSVPDGWVTYDGKEKRVGFVGGFSAGGRLFQLTGEKHDFPWGLYTRNLNGGKKKGYARYADEGTNTTLTLYPGNYQILHKVANWNRPNFTPVTLAIETIDGKEVYSETFTPTSNIGNKASSSFSGTTMVTSVFDINKKDRYVITFYTADGVFDDLVVGQAAIKRKGNVTAVEGAKSDGGASIVSYFNLSGQPVDTPQRGIFIEKLTTSDGKTTSRKVVF